jgi:hypothetical protein
MRQPGDRGVNVVGDTAICNGEHGQITEDVQHGENIPLCEEVYNTIA